MTRTMLALATLLLATTLFPGHQTVGQNEPGTLITAFEGAPYEVSSISIVGNIDGFDGPVTTSFSRTERGAIISVSSLGEPAIDRDVVFSSAEFPLIDIESFTTFQLDFVENQEVLPGLYMVFHFGEERSDCFTNHDGRNEVELTIGSSNHYRIYVTDYENCQINLRLHEEG